MKKRFILITAIMLCLAMLMPTALADTGPKPSVNISFEGMGDEPCYATLLSKRESTGPHYVWDGVSESNMEWSGLDEDSFNAFYSYKDPDGYYFLQYGARVDESKSFSWGYYPPEEFKLLLWYPETNSFVSSACLERYAFDSYFSVDMTDFSVAQGENAELNAEKSYDYGREIVSLIVRIVLTVAIELIVALLFGYREKTQLKLIALVNIITQVILNVFVNVAHFTIRGWTFVLLLVIGEIIVFTAEAIFYSVKLKSADKKHPRLNAVLYAIAANTASLVLGRVILLVLPLS